MKPTTDRSAITTVCLLTVLLGLPILDLRATTVPAVIQAEAYDDGGEGVAYHDESPGNLGGVLRNDDVDLFAHGAGDFYVGDTSAGEWLGFTISAASDMMCRVRYRVASVSPQPAFNLRLEIGGVTKDVVVSGISGGATNWSDIVSSRPFEIQAGDHVAKVSFLSSGLNLDEIEFIIDSDPQPGYLDPSLPLTERVEDLLGRMTTDEKIGQTCLVDRQFLTGSPGGDPAHQESDIRSWLLGGLLSGGGSTPSPNTVETWADMVDRFQAYALSTRLGIPILYGSDAVHGHNNMHDATIFPHNIGLGASGDADLVERIARATALECAASGVRWAFAPSVSVARDGRWGRVYESFGETPELGSRLAAAAVRGLHGADLSEPGAVLACAKHYVADGGAMWGTGGFGTIDRGNAVIDEATLRDLHLPPFEAAISGGCLTVMAAFSTWNGAMLHGHRYLLTDVLKGELGFEGFILSDWQGIDSIDYGSYRTAIVSAVNAGVDVCMIPDRYVQYSQEARVAVAAQRISGARLDDAVRRILAAKFKLGLFERPFSDRSLIPMVRSPQHLALAREGVARSIVLLKDDSHLLPLSKRLTRIHVAGRHARDIGLQCGGWTVSWQGGSGATTAGTTIFDAIAAAVSEQTSVTYSADGSAAAGADIGVVVIGEEPYAEFFGDTDELRPSAADLARIAAVKSAGIPVVVMIVSGRPLIIDPDIDGWDACLAIWLPGSEGEGVADVLFADQFAGATLPQTWPRSGNSFPINVGDAGYDPLYPFGFGISLRPSLSIAAGTDSVTLAWPASSGGFALEFAESLGEVDWIRIPDAPSMAGDHFSLDYSTAGKAKGFFRLSQP